jgi:hypothetical protein
MTGFNKHKVLSDKEGGNLNFLFCKYERVFHKLTKLVTRSYLQNRKFKLPPSLSESTLCLLNPVIVFVRKVLNYE